MIKFARTIRPLLAALVVVALFAVVASACPTCKEGLDASDPQHQSAAAGFYYSIIFMMSMPYLLLSSLGGLAYLSIRRAQQQQVVDAGSEVVGDIGVS